LTRVVLLALALVGCRQAVNWNDDPRWAAVPITFEWTAISPTFDASLSRALEAWNFAAGCHVAEKAKDPVTANVSVGPYEGTICGSSRVTDLDTVPGAVAGSARCSVSRAEIRFKVMSDPRSVYVAGAHEDGHVFGLAHDRSLIMRPAAPGYDPSSGANMDILPWVSDADGAAIGARYCR
jgi:hypothetical protein